MSFPTYGDAVDIAGLEAAIVEMFGQRVKSGSLPVSFSSQVSYTQAVSFGTLFASTPRVTVNITSASGATAGWEGRATNVTASGFTLFLYGPSSTWTGSAVQWIATDLGNA